MATDTPRKIHHEISSLLSRRNLREAFALLSQQLADAPSFRLMDLLKQQEETYRYLLHYFAEGYPDDSRIKRVDGIVARLSFINDSLLRDRIVKDSPDSYSAALRLERVRKASLTQRLAETRRAESLASLAREAGGDVSLRRQADEHMLNLFEYVWTMFGSSSDDYAALRDAVLDRDTPFAIRAQVISALMLGNMAYFDAKGLAALLDIFEADADPKISARALVAIILVIASHPGRVGAEPELASRLSLWNDSIMIYRQLREVVMAIIRARDTERISSKMKDEVLPELMKLKPEILDKLRNASAVEDIEQLEYNPEWEEILNKNGLSDKLRELTDMQTEGGDVMMMAFSNLKGFPFFNSVSNWFLPFTTDHHDVMDQSNGQLDAFNEMLEMDGIMCNSDKYSFAFSLFRMPEAQRQAISVRMSEQLDQLRELMADRKLKSSVPEFDAETTRYVRDIYRFFKLYRRKEDFKDPFAEPLDFLSLPFVSSVLSDPEILTLVSEFYFKRKYYPEAMSMFLMLDASGSDDPQLWEKIGYCHTAMHNPSEALKWYSKAELIHPDSNWLLKVISQTYRELKDYALAAEYLSRVLMSEPENPAFIETLAADLMMAGETAGALQHFYHADYIAPSIRSERGIAWGEFLKKDWQKSIAMHDRIVARDEATPGDWVNRGHARLLSSDIKGALADYRKAAGQKDFGVKGLEHAMEIDADVLLSLGAAPETLHLVIEKIKYELPDA